MPLTEQEESTRSHRAYEANIDQIDNHVPEKYDGQALATLLGHS